MCEVSQRFSVKPPEEDNGPFNSWIESQVCETFLGKIFRNAPIQCVKKMSKLPDSLLFCCFWPNACHHLHLLLTGNLVPLGSHLNSQFGDAFYSTIMHATCYVVTVGGQVIQLLASCQSGAVCWKMCASTTMVSLKFPLQDPLQQEASINTTIISSKLIYCNNYTSRSLHPTPVRHQLGKHCT